MQMYICVMFSVRYADWCFDRLFAEVLLLGLSILHLICSKAIV